MLRLLTKWFTVDPNARIITEAEKFTTQKYHDLMHSALSAAALAVCSVRSLNACHFFRAVCADDGDCDSSVGEECCPLTKVCENPDNADAGACGKTISVTVVRVMSHHTVFV